MSAAKVVKHEKVSAIQGMCSVRVTVTVTVTVILTGHTLAPCFKLAAYACVSPGRQAASVSGVCDYERFENGSFLARPSSVCDATVLMMFSSTM